jgi:hypothetical protein
LPERVLRHTHQTVCETVDMHNLCKVAPPFGKCILEIYLLCMLLICNNKHGQLIVAAVAHMTVTL